jgi:hypothetical protein
VVFEEVANCDPRFCIVVDHQDDLPRHPDQLALFEGSHG